MTTYYEFLEIDPSASRNEIENMIDEKYEKWRQLVTHHDPQVVANANQALLSLEKIRGVLMDGDKKADYDASLENSGGLEDPDAVHVTNPFLAMAPPSLRKKAPAEQAAAERRVDAWICTNNKCNTANAVGEKFCAKCGTVIGQRCPQCGDLVEFSAKFCSSCGVNKQDHFNVVQAERVNGVQAQIKANQEVIGDCRRLANQPFLVKNSLNKVPLTVEMSYRQQSIVIYFPIPTFALSMYLVIWRSAGLSSVLILWIIYFIAFFLSQSGDIKNTLSNEISNREQMNKNLRTEIQNIQSEKYGQFE